MSIGLNRICLIEANELMGEALVDRFDLEGFSCEWFKTGESARAALGCKVYEVVVCDISLPDCDGEILFEEMRNAGMSLAPNIFISDHGEIDRAVHLLKLDAVDWMSRPLDIRSLLEKVRALCVGDSPNYWDASVPGTPSTMHDIESVLPRLTEGTMTESTSGKPLSDYIQECERR